MDKILAGQVALVTGAGRGFGAGIARGLARAGAHVTIVDINAAELAETAQEILNDSLAEQSEVLTQVADVSDFGQMEAAVSQTVSRWGRLDIVVNNAATMPLVSFADSDPSFWRKMLDVNLTGVYNGVKSAWPHLIRQGGGHCIAIASGASVRGFVNEVAYCAAKHGIEGFTKALAMEAEPHKIAINTMGPGKLIKPTEISREGEVTVDPAVREKWVDPVDLASAFVWLSAQPPSRFTGLRFDAGPIADTVAAEGYDFDFTPEKVTLYVDDFIARQNERSVWSGHEPTK